MKKILVILLVLFLLGLSAYFSALHQMDEFSYLFIKEQLKDKSGEESINQVRTLLSQCIDSSRDRSVRFFCKVFLENKFPKLQEKWWNISTGGVEFIKWWSLSNEKWLEYAWLSAIAKQGWKNEPLSGDKDEREDIKKRVRLSDSYYKVRYHFLPFSLLLPYTDCSKNLDKFCRNKSDISSRIVSFHLGDSYYNRTLSVDTLNGLWSRTEMEELDMGGKLFEEMIVKFNDESKNNINDGREISVDNNDRIIIYFDNNGNFYSKHEEIRKYLKSLGNTVVEDYTGDYSELKKWYIGFWPNMQKLFASGEAKIVDAWRQQFIWLASTPNKLYIRSYSGSHPLSLTLSPFALIDVDASDWTLAFEWIVK